MPTVHHEGADIHYGVQGSGAPVLLVAGTGYAGATWHPDFVSALAADHAVVTFDHRGTGQSSSSDGLYSTQLFARDALAVLDAAALGPAHVLGHSMGGRVAQWMAIERPQSVASLVLASTGAGAPTRVEVSRVGVPIGTVLSLLEKDFAAFIADAQRRTFFTEAYADAGGAMVEWLLTAYLASRPHIKDYLKHVQARQAHSARADIGRITMPTLIVVGAEDTHTGATGSHFDQSIELNRLIEGSVMEILPGLKHGIFWEGMDGCVALMGSWISRLAPA
jgi:pimeloyl-ACP methyl ester carboxylesterase